MAVHLAQLLEHHIKGLLAHQELDPHEGDTRAVSYPRPTHDAGGPQRGGLVRVRVRVRVRIRVRVRVRVGVNVRVGVRVS